MRIMDYVMDVPMNTRFGSFLCGAYRTYDEQGQVFAEHMLLYQHLHERPCNLRLNSACFTSGIFGDNRCDCAWQMEYALNYILRRRQGLLVYHLHHEGRANGLIEKLRSFEAAARYGAHGARAYTSQGLPADAREFDSALAILRHLGIDSVNLISNNLEKQRALTAAGIDVASRIPAVCTHPHLHRYYDWKRHDFDHLV